MGHVRKNNGIGRIPTPPQIQVREGKLSAQDLQVLYNAVMALYPLINGGITFGNGDSFSYSGNLDGEWVPAGHARARDARWRSDAMTIPMVDLKAQYLDLKEEIDREVAAVLGSGHFILGPNVQ